jgi:hypothetical protein
MADLPIKITSSRAMPDGSALLISGPLRIKATPELRKHFAKLTKYGVKIIDDRIEFASFEHAAAGLTIAEIAGVVTREEVIALINEAAEELRSSGRAVLAKSLGSES